MGKFRASKGTRFRMKIRESNGFYEGSVPRYVVEEEKLKKGDTVYFRVEEIREDDN